MSRWDHPELNAAIEALDRVSEARKECQEEHERYTGWSWGYHGARYIQAVDDATDALAEAIDALIDARIKERLQK